MHETCGNLGGAEAAVVLSAAELRRRGHEVALLSLRDSGKGEAQWREAFRSGTYRAAGPEEGLRSALTTFKPEVVFIHKWSDTRTLEMLADGGGPVVRMVHDHDGHCLRGYRYNPLTRKVCHKPAGNACLFPCLAPIQRNRGGGLPVRLASLSDHLRALAACRRFPLQLAISRYMRDELLLNGFNPHRISLCPPVPPEGPPTAPSTFSAENHLVFAGQLVRGKGLDVLLKALAEVAVHFRLTVLGDGPERVACERLSAKLGLSERVRFVGYVPREQLDAFYAQATAVMVPSVWPEPFGLVGVEAMRRGLPVVAFEAGGVRDWLTDGETGFVVPWMDRAAYADRVTALLEDKSLARRLGAAGRAKAAAEFTFTRHIDTLERELNRVIWDHAAGLAAA